MSLKTTGPYLVYTELLCKLDSYTVHRSPGMLLGRLVTIQDSTTVPSDFET